MCLLSVPLTEALNNTLPSDLFLIFSCFHKSLEVQWDQVPFICSHIPRNGKYEHVVERYFVFFKNDFVSENK